MNASKQQREGKEEKTLREIKVKLKKIKTMFDLNSILQCRTPEQNMQEVLGQSGYNK